LKLGIFIYNSIAYAYFPDSKILQTRLQNLTWSHIQAALGEKTQAGRNCHLKEAGEQM
jgi:hypothetical protein